MPAAQRSRAPFGLALTALQLVMAHSSFTFDPEFGKGVVLQRAPLGSSINGTVDSFASSVDVKLVDSDTGAEVTTISATLGVILPNFELAESTMRRMTWHAHLPLMPAGGHFKLSASCTGCFGHPAPITLEDVTFGDVWICAGRVSIISIQSITI